MAQRCLFIDKHTGVVWSSVRDDVAHPDDALSIVRMEALRRDDARDTAHGWLGLAAAPVGALDAVTPPVRHGHRREARRELTTVFVVIASDHPFTVVREYGELRVGWSPGM
jgi:hypothetical protein